jgi:hypothetical protein
MPNDRPEAPAVATRAVMFSAIGFLVFVGISLVVLHIYYSEEINQAVFVPPTPFAKPRLQTNDVDDLAKLQAGQRARLGGYAWVDREKGIISIPIEEAMKRIVARGTNAYAPIASITPAQQGAGGGKQP